MIGGITNGAEWYTIRGGMQDFNYIFSDCMELTIEVENCKYPESNTIEHDWTLNKDSLIKYLKAAHYGIKGYVTDRQVLNLCNHFSSGFIHFQCFSMGKKIAGARIVVKDNDRYVYSSNCGEYWRLLVPGIYEVRAFGPGGLFSDWKLVKIPSLSHEALRLDLVMDMVDLSQADSQVDYIPSLRNTLGNDICIWPGTLITNTISTQRVLQIHISCRETNNFILIEW